MTRPIMATKMEITVSAFVGGEVQYLCVAYAPMRRPIIENRIVRGDGMPVWTKRLFVDDATTDEVNLVLPSGASPAHLSSSALLTPSPA